MAVSAELVLNGINGATGRYIDPILETTVERVAAERDPAIDQGLIPRGAGFLEGRGKFEDFDELNLAEAGWAVVFAPGVAESTRQALKPLIDLRQAQAGDLFRQLEAGPKETATRFLERQNIAPGDELKPSQLPYYVLIVGDPKDTSYRFQYTLDVDRAVGRIAFSTDEEYSRYAQTVVAAESAVRGAGRRRAAFFATRNHDDLATQMSCDDLVKRLVEGLPARHPEWDFQSILAEDATKARLSGLIGRDAKPNFLFSASHGLFFDKDNQDQAARQGALVCQDWPGPVEFGEHPIPPEFVYAGDDLADDADVRGMVAFFFACFGLGTPRHDDFLAQASEDNAEGELAAHAFVARLPQRLLAHPGGGALAVFGHVDRAWPSSFESPGMEANVEAFAKAVRSILRSEPVGLALESLNERHARLTVRLADEREETDTSRAPADPALLASLFKARNDARNYALFGDPAVRLT